MARNIWEIMKEGEELKAWIINQMQVHRQDPDAWTKEQDTQLGEAGQMLLALTQEIVDAQVAQMSSLSFYEDSHQVSISRLKN